MYFKFDVNPWIVCLLFYLSCSIVVWAAVARNNGTITLIPPCSTAMSNIKIKLVCTILQEDCDWKLPLETRTNYSNSVSSYLIFFFSANCVSDANPHELSPNAAVRDIWLHMLPLVTDAWLWIIHFLLRTFVRALHPASKCMQIMGAWRGWVFVTLN